MRRYRWLLATYPRAYRRRRGEEILGTLLDELPPGRERPTIRQAAGLVLAGLRSRLSRPSSRTVVLWSVLMALVSGVIGAAGGQRLAWQAAGQLPTDRQVRQVVAATVPGSGATSVDRTDYLFGSYGAWTPVRRDREAQDPQTGNEYTAPSSNLIIYFCITWTASRAGSKSRSGP